MMDTRQREKEKEKEKEKDLATGERTPKVSGVVRKPSDIASGCSVRAYGPIRFVGYTHFHFLIISSNSLGNYCVV